VCRIGQGTRVCRISFGALLYFVNMLEYATTSSLNVGRFQTLSFPERWWLWAIFSQQKPFVVLTAHFSFITRCQKFAPQKSPGFNCQKWEKYKNLQIFIFGFLFACRVLFFSILWGRCVGKHPQDESAKFGHRSERTVQKYRIRAMFWQPAQTYCLNMAILFLFFSL
jgi:hypothetical protein